MHTLARHYARHGVTSFLATTMTLPGESLLRAAKAIGSFTRGEGEAKCAGIHLEGPFLSYEKRGAQCADYLADPDATLFSEISAASGNLVREITVAPERKNALPFIRETARSCTVSLGHTAASYALATEAFAAGASQLTHTYNGMNPLLHREPGVIGAGMDASANAELICDGLHVHPSAIRAAFRLFPNRVVLISDSLRCAGLSDGEYDLGTQAVTKVNARCTLTGTDTLAGSVITVYDALINVVRFGVPLEAAAAAATIQPARAVRLSKTCGAIRPGAASDLLLLDGGLDRIAVWIDGQRVIED